MGPHDHFSQPRIRRVPRNFLVATLTHRTPGPSEARLPLPPDAEKVKAPFFFANQFSGGFYESTELALGEAVRTPKTNRLPVAHLACRTISTRRSRPLAAAGGDGTNMILCEEGRLVDEHGGNGADVNCRGGAVEMAPSFLQTKG